MSDSVDLGGTDLVVVTATRYSSAEDVRYQVALRTLSAYSDRGVPVIVMDGGSPAVLFDSFRERGAVVRVAPRPGLATQYIDGVKVAQELGATSACILRQEPEKLALAECLPAIRQALIDHDVVVIGRTEAAFRSLPPMQERTERLCGWLFEELFGLPPDSLAGARAFTSIGVEHLLSYEEEYLESLGNNWMHLYTCCLAAARAGLRVGGTAVDMFYPPEIYRDETQNPIFDGKRIEQLLMQLEGMGSVFGSYHRPSSAALRVVEALSIQE